MPDEPADRFLSDRAVGVLCGLLTVAGVAMIALGLPEQTLLQRRMLQLYSVPLSGALALGVVHLTAKLPAIDRATGRVLAIAGGATLLGVVLIGAGVLLGVDGLLPPGQALMWLSLGFALVWVVRGLPRRRGRTFGLEEDAEDD